MREEVAMRARKLTLGGLAGAAILGCVSAPANAQGLQSAPVRPTPPAATAPTAAPKPAAVVNGEQIAMAELEAVLKRQPPQPTAMPERMQIAVRREALAMLIDECLLHQFLRKSCPPVAKADIDKKLAEISDIMKAKGKSMDDFYKDAQETPEELRTSLGYQLQWAGYCNARATDQALQKYYTENKDFFDGVMVEVSHIVLRVPSGAAPTEVAAARDRLTKLRKDILDKKIDFAQAAKQYSECESAPRGGEIGCISRKGIDDAFAKAAFALQVGQVSDVVQSSFGLHLIKVTDRKPGKPSDFATAKEHVRMMFLGDLNETILQELRNTAKIEINIP
jgi:peptidyl-prolyl cis-trans isomerase C